VIGFRIHSDQITKKRVPYYLWPYSI